MTKFDIERIEEAKIRRARRAEKRARPVSDSRLIMTLYNNDGTIYKQTVGPNWKKRVALHKDGKCDAFCGICYEAGCRYMEKKNALHN